MAVSIGAAAVATMVYSTYEQQEAENSAHDARKAQEGEQRKQFAAQQRIADIKNARERAEIARRTRVAKAESVNTGANTGTMNSSGVAGGAASAVSQGSSYTGSFNAISANQADIVSSQGREASAIANLGDAQAQMQQMQNLFSLGATVFTAAGGFKTIFDSTKKTK